MRLIDANQLLKTSFRIVGKIGNKYPFEAIAISEIKASPTIDPESLRKHGRWKQYFEDWRKQIEGYRCSACGFKHFGYYYQYCPSCGAKMDLEE